MTRRSWWEKLFWGANDCCYTDAQGSITCCSRKTIHVAHAAAKTVMHSSRARRQTRPCIRCGGPHNRRVTLQEKHQPLLSHPLLFGASQRNSLETTAITPHSITPSRVYIYIPRRSVICFYLISEQIYHRGTLYIHPGVEHTPGDIAFRPQSFPSAIWGTL